VAARATPDVAIVHLRLLLIPVAIALVSCGEATVCTSDLRVRVSPTDTTIRPGEQFTIRVSLLGCSGTKVLSDQLTWTSSDIGVAVVETGTGTVIGAQAGKATILIRGATYGQVGQTMVTVR
jgi:uncharacterized protein YjdB